MRQSDIRQIRGTETLSIRQQVLWPNKTVEDLKIPEDDEGIHLGYFVEGQLIGVLSMFYKGEQCQIRKFAVLETFQGKGYGSKLLERSLEIAKEAGIKGVWLRARAGAVGLYERHGFNQDPDCEVFCYDGVEYRIMRRTSK